nr:MAG TPA: hypothetical protein [Caudoviricetes sp.]
MDELMQKITEKLNLTIDKAPEVYEMLKWQHVIYDTVNHINAILCILLFAVGFVELFFLMYVDDIKKYKKIILLSFIPLVVMILLIIILLIYRNINAPDVLFLKGVLRM